jgi:hypothetical protein
LVYQDDAVKDHGRAFEALANLFHQSHGNLSFAKTSWCVQQLATMAGSETGVNLLHHLRLVGSQ